LAAADCAQLALMLSNERLRAAAYADTLANLRGGQGGRSAPAGPAAASEQQQQQQQQPAQEAQQHGQQQPAGAEAGGLAAVVERVGGMFVTVMWPA
jgi:hypothetical protein